MITVNKHHFAVSRHPFAHIEYEKAGGTRKSDKKRSSSSNTNSENAAK